jgi:peptide-methionine (S)-S-oxide reductase
LGNHTESIQIDFDPETIRYEELLAVFWDSHSPTHPSGSRQYASIIFTHDAEQRHLATESKRREEARRGTTLYTDIEPFQRFYLAENYHQKYHLRRERVLMRDFKAMYPDAEDFVASTAAARVNGYVGGHGTREQIRKDIGRLGLSEAGRKRLRELAERAPATACPVGAGR